MDFCISNLSIWAQVISAFAAAAGFIGLAVQIHRSRTSLGIELVLKLDDRFNSKDFRTLRIKAVKSIMKNNFKDAEEIYDFFETVGLLLRKRAIDKEMVWNTFFHWIHYYWIVGSDYIANEQRADSPAWEDFKHLHEQVIKVEKIRTKASDSELLLSAEDIKSFLKDESMLN
jgi:hypothetical protein